MHRPVNTLQRALPAGTPGNAMKDRRVEGRGRVMQRSAAISASTEGRQREAKKQFSFTKGSTITKKRIRMRSHEEISETLLTEVWFFFTLQIKYIAVI